MRRPSSTWIGNMVFIQLLGFILAQLAYADCVSPAAVGGQFQYISPHYKYCDGTDWQSMTVAPTGVNCAGEENVLKRDGTDLIFCNGTEWVSVDGDPVGAVCNTQSPGTIEWDPTLERMKWCNGTDWKYIGGG